MTMVRLGANRLSEVMRMIEVLRGKQQMSAGGEQSGWGAVTGPMSGGAVAKDPQYGTFLGQLQERLLKEYSAASMKKSFLR